MLARADTSIELRWAEHDGSPLLLLLRFFRGSDRAEGKNPHLLARPPTRPAPVPRWLTPVEKNCAGPKGWRLVRSLPPRRHLSLPIETPGSDRTAGLMPFRDEPTRSRLPGRGAGLRGFHGPGADYWLVITCDAVPPASRSLAPSQGISPPRRRCSCTHIVFPRQRNDASAYSAGGVGAPRRADSIRV
jgi:hypothetical protein